MTLTPWAEQAVEHRAIWGTEQLIIDGRDYTLHNDAPFVTNSEQFVSPWGYGPASFTLPGLTNFEAATARALKGKPVIHLHTTPDGARHVLWRGFVLKPNPRSDGTHLECAGEPTGRLAAAVKLPRPFPFRKDTGRILYDMARSVGITVLPTFGLTTGERIDEGSIAGSSRLEACADIMARSEQNNGQQLVVHPEGPHGDRYRMQWLDTTTVHATLFLNSNGVDDDLADDLLEQPTTEYILCRDADGGLHGNFRAPNFVAAQGAPYPGFDLHPGDGNDPADPDYDAQVVAINTLQVRLIGVGYLARVDALGGGYNDATVEAIENIQDEAGLPQTGIINAATWNAVYDAAVTDISVRQSFMAPAAQLLAAKRFLRNAAGFILGPNPAHDRDLVDVQRLSDLGTWPLRSSNRWARRQIARNHSGAKHWAGTITLTDVDLFPGDYHHGDPLDPADLISWRTPMYGWNIMLRGFDGDTLLHVASDLKNPESKTVTLNVDAQARPALEVAQKIRRNQESRSRPGRVLELLHRGTRIGGSMEWLAELGGKTSVAYTLQAMTWKVIPLAVGDFGTIARTRIELANPGEFVYCFVVEEVTPRWCERNIGNPWAHKWKGGKVADLIDRKRILLYATGIEDDPGGYGPTGSKTEGDPLTGIHLDDGPWSYVTKPQDDEHGNRGIIYLCIKAKTDNVLPAQQILRPSAEIGM